LNVCTGPRPPPGPPPGMFGPPSAVASRSSLSTPSIADLTGKAPPWPFLKISYSLQLMKAFG
jgi:hypothetical protein